MKKPTFAVQSVFLFALIPVILLSTLWLAWETHRALYQAIMRGFDRQLVAVSTVTGAFLDGERHQNILARRRIEGLAWHARANVFYGVDTTSGELLSINPVTGGAESHGRTGFPSIADVAYDPGRHVLYAVDSSEMRLLQINPDTAQTRVVGTIGLRCYGLAFDPTRDVLYCAGQDLIRLDVESGLGRRVASLGFEAVRGLAYDQSTGTLYGVDAAQNALIRINTDTGKGSRIAGLRPSEVPEAEKTPPPVPDQRQPQYEGDPPLLPLYGLAFAPGNQRLFASATRLVAINPTTARVWNHGFAGYRNEQSRLYLDYIRPMRRIQKKRGITYLYTFVQKTDSPLDITYVLDANTDRNHSFVGDQDQLPAEEAERVYDHVQLGKTYISGIHFWELWGLLKTGYAPIWNAQGAVTATVGTDINVTIIGRKTRVALVKTVLLGVLALGFAACIVYAITRRLVQPIRQLQDAALAVAAGSYGRTVPLRGPTELVGLSAAFNQMSQNLKVFFEEKIQANNALEARICRRALHRTLSREADGTSVSHTKALCYRRLGAEDTSGDLSGWVASPSHLLLWLASSGDTALHAVRRRREIAYVAMCILDRYAGTWEHMASKLQTLLDDAVNSFIFMDADSGRIYTLARQPVMAIVKTQSGMRYCALAPDQPLTISTNQACIVGPVEALEVISHEVDGLRDETVDAEEMIARIAETLEAQASNRPVGTTGLSQVTIGVMSRVVWWHRQPTPPDEV